MTLEEMYGNAKALVEDRTYNIGEISEKTGLQKTANGWVKPKSNNGKSSPTPEGKKEIELRKAAMNGGTKERKALFKFEAENADDEQLKYILRSKNQPAERIEMYKAELEKRNSKSRIPQHLEEVYSMNTDITKEDEERFGKAALSGLSGNRTKDSACRITADTKIRLNQIKKKV